MENNLMVSVITPVYNHEKFIGETIQSVISQSYKNWEMLVVDDCSTDKSWEVIQTWVKKDSRIKAFRNETNRGLIENWKFLIGVSMGEYLAFLEGDDFFYNDNLKNRIRIFEKYPDLGMVYCNFKVVDENGNILIGDARKKLNTKTYRNERIDPAEYLYAKRLLFSTYSQIMVRRNALSVSGYPTSFDHNEKVFLPSDWDFNFRLSTENKIYFVSETLLGYRKHSANNSAATLKVSKQLLMILDNYAKNFSHNEKIQEAIRYMRGKTYYFNAIYYLENSLKKDAWREFFAYAKKYPKNFYRDFIPSILLLGRLFLPDRFNAYLKKKYFNG